MQEVSINFWALLTAVVVKEIIGAIWFSPAVAAPKWRELTGVTLDQVKKGMAKAMIVDIIATFVMAFVLLHAVRYAGAHTVLQGAVVGFFNWLGFIAAPGIAAAVFERRPLMLFAITGAYLLIALIVMGAILAVWP